MICLTVACMCLAAMASAWAEPTASPQEALDQLDPRKPLPLLPMMANHQKANMRDHLQAVQEIIAGLPNNDFAAIERASSRMGFSEKTAKMCQHMGLGAPGFTEMGVNFHKTADTIGEAARARNADGVLRALGRTLAACTNCHASYKQQVVDSTMFSKLGGTPPPMPENNSPQQP